MSFAMNPPVRPFLPYNNPSISSVEDLNAFNPKRISQQSQEPVVPKPKMTAPYIQLDQSMNAKIERAHRLNAAPISKRGLLIVRILAILLRIPQLAGAMGLLVCTLFIRKMDDMTGWITRVPPAVAIFHVVYFIYHVSSSDRARTPRSSVSYFLFASTVDLAIISFYAFIAILSWKQYQGTADSPWATIFNNPEITQKIFMSVFLITCAAGGLALVSLLLTLYLVRVFRRLANLSPDQNPFLDEKDTYIQLPSKRWSQSTTDSTAPSLPESSKAVPFLATRHSDMSARDTIQYHNIPVPPPHTQRLSQLYPATGHLYPASGPVAYDTTAAAETESIRSETASTKRGKKSWGNLKAPTAAKRKESATIIAEASSSTAERSTSSTLHPEEDGRSWSFSFRKRSGAAAGMP